MRTSSLGRGLVALAAAGMISLGLLGVARAQSYADKNGALAEDPNPGYAATLVHPGSAPAAEILVSNGSGDVGLAIQFLPAQSGGTVLEPGVSDLNAPRH